MSRKIIVRKEFWRNLGEKSTLSLSLVFEFGGIRMYLYVQTRVSRLIFRVLDILKGLRAGPHQRGRLWALKIEVLERALRTQVYACVRMKFHAYVYVPINPNSNSSNVPTLNSHNSLNLSPK